MSTRTESNSAVAERNDIKTRISVARGDGIGPEITDAVLSVLRAAGAQLDVEEVVIGQAVYERGVSSGIEDDAWESIRRTDAFLKAPVTTPLGGGFKSVNVTMRKTLGLFANVRPSIAYTPFVASSFPGMDVVVIRENEEDTYGGIEHQQTDEVVQCLKLITVPGSRRVIRYAFEYARAHGRKRVTCLSKDNIMKLTDGLFHRVFNEIASEYPDIENDHLLIDIGAAKIAADPRRFDVIVTPNLYGDIVSDITAELSGSVGMAGSANIGVRAAMFEAVHGSAPDIAGTDIANPSGLLQAAVLMLLHMGQADVARSVRNAWLSTIEDGIHTADIAGEHTTRTVGTREFAREVVARIGSTPRTLQAAQIPDTAVDMGRVLDTSVSLDGGHQDSSAQVFAVKELAGVDIFLDWDSDDRNPNALGTLLETLSGHDFRLSMITNRGTKVYPDGAPETFCTDHWRCRFVAHTIPATQLGILGLLGRLTESGLDVIKTENLYLHNGVAGYSKGQGE